MKNNQGGFGPIELLLLLAIVILLGMVGWLLTDGNNKPITTSIATTNNNGTTATTDTTTSSPAPVYSYVGWQSYTIADENLSFKYPPNWTLTNPGVDDNEGILDIVIRAPDDFYVEVQSINFSPTDSESSATAAKDSGNPPTQIIYAQPITYLGTKAYIDYQCQGKCPSIILQGWVSKSATESLDNFKSRNLNPQTWLDFIVYPALNQNKSVINSKPDYIDAKLIIESASY